MDKLLEITVGIPNYNKGRYLLNTIQSVLNQTYKVKEIIIVDDCSTDNSPSIIHNLAKKYDLIRPIILEKNVGVSAARNICISKCKTEYITFIDADDFYYDTRKIENEMKLIEQHLPKDIIAYSYIKRADESGKIIESSEDALNYYEGDVFDKYFKKRGGIGFARDYCVKTTILKEVGGYIDRLSLYEDLALLYQLALKHEFYCTGQFGTAYRQVGNGLSSKPDAEHTVAINYIRKIILNKLTFNKKFYYISYWNMLAIARKLRSIIKKR